MSIFGKLFSSSSSTNETDAAWWDELSHDGSWMTVRVGYICPNCGMPGDFECQIGDLWKDSGFFEVEDECLGCDKKITVTCTEFNKSI